MSAGQADDVGRTSKAKTAGSTGKAIYRSLIAGAGIDLYGRGAEAGLPAPR